MSRSRRKTSISGITTATTEKQFKRKTARQHRHRANIAIHCSPLEDPELPVWREIEQWGPKDGKRFFDAMRWPKAMRK
jgi:hypothetical protein